MYQDDEEQPYDQRDENSISSEEEISSHYCEVCDREFVNAELLQRHQETHTTCGIDGCTFFAHPKLVEKHISMQHCTGLYQRMKNLSTPEDIEKWIAERKKKYPTKTNIEHKKAEETEKIERGEIIQAKRPASKQLDKPVREKKRKIRKRKNQKCKPNPEPIVELYRGLRPFAGTANLAEITNEDEVEVENDEKSVCESPVMDFECVISDEEEQPIIVQQLEINCEKKLDSEPVIETNCDIEKATNLGSLVANYGSDSSDDEAPSEMPIKRTKLDLPVDENPQNLPSSSVAKSPEKSQEKILEIAKSPEKSQEEISKNCTAKAEIPRDRKSTNDRSKDYSTEEKTRKNSRENVSNFSNNRNSKRLMLLQRLLSRSMQHERNLICQCIKYIHDNNFLQ